MKSWCSLETYWIVNEKISNGRQVCVQDNLLTHIFDNKELQGSITRNYEGLAHIFPIVLISMLADLLCTLKHSPEILTTSRNAIASIQRFLSRHTDGQRLPLKLLACNRASTLEFSSREYLAYWLRSLLDIVALKHPVLFITIVSYVKWGMRFLFRSF